MQKNSQTDCTAGLFIRKKNKRLHINKYNYNKTCLCLENLAKRVDVVMAMYIPQLSGRIRVKWRRAYDVARTKRRGRRLGRAPGRGVRYATRSHARGREGKHLCPSSAYRALRVRLRSQSQSPNETAVSLRANGARLAMCSMCSLEALDIKKRIRLLVYLCEIYKGVR